MLRNIRIWYSLAALLVSGALLSSCAGQSGSSLPSQTNSAATTGGGSKALGVSKSSNTRYGCAGPAAQGYSRCFVQIRTDIGAGNPKGYHGLYRTKSGTKVAAAPAFVPPGYGPSDLQSAYQLSNASANNGAGETIAIVDAFDDPTAESDLAVYRSQYGLPPCTTANGCFLKLNQYGGTPYPGTDPTGGWEIEESLDLQMVSAMCPNCHVVLIEATNNANSNLATAENTAARGANVISNSFGGREFQASSPSFTHPGHVITASSGDDGYGVQQPAAYSTVVAVGGTSLTQTSGSSRGWSETAWSGAGSGCSAFVAKPSWQHDALCPKRSEADVSAVADPNTPVAVYDTNAVYGTGWFTVGGTSVASPIVAAVYGLAGSTAAQNGAQRIWTDAGADLFDVISGSNGTCSISYLCNAGPGYDGPTGWGTPNGLIAFGKFSSTTSVVVNDAGTNAPWSGTETALASAYGTATVAGTGSATPTGTVNFAFYAAGACSGTPTSTQGVALTNGSANSSATAALQPGSYAYQATYAGDTNYLTSTSSCAPFTVHPCAFSSFSSNLQITEQPEFALHANFAPSSSCKSPINVGTQQVAITVGSYAISLPAGALVLQKNGSYVYKGVVNGASLNIKVTPNGAGYVLDDTGTSVSPAQSNPVPVTLTIGNTTGTISVNANFGH